MVHRETADLELREPAERCGDVPRGEQQGDAFGLEAARAEQQRVGGRLVQPVRVVDKAEQAAVDGQLAEQGQDAGGHLEAALVVPLGEAQRGADRLALRGRQVVDRRRTG